ncbi:MAG: hypothetical protein IIZ38_19695 [Sphingomonas sp.]|uniref:hypothetical protein n=1 Tax=Sphingomonas sp. TaxID=28214 RepID=UPI0025F13C38|nr:hypothetical protein [Sphingomonas sp.]MBQ1500536.1 hypothetical protein [Sphingomonas sp.]
MALIFRARRAPAPAPAIRRRAADGIAVTLAPRLQIVLNLWTRLGDAHHDHRATRIDARQVAAPMTQAGRTRHLHVHRDWPPPARAGHAPSPRSPGHPRAARAPTAGSTLARWPVQAPPKGENIAPRPAVIRAASAPSPLRSGPGAALHADARARLAPASAPASPRRFPRSAPLPPAESAADLFGTGRRTASARLSVRAFAVRRGAAAAPAPERPGSTSGAVAPRHRSAPLAPLAFAAPAGTRRAGASGALAIAPPSRQVAVAALDFRRPAAPAATPEAAPAPRAAPQPQAPAIDVDAISRDVIGRIEKRLRIERERHGRI